MASVAALLLGLLLRPALLHALIGLMADSRIVLVTGDPQATTAIDVTHQRILHSAPPPSTCRQTPFTLPRPASGTEALVSWIALVLRRCL
jgi:hypothetical protein